MLLDLKSEYKTLTGIDFPVAGRAPSKAKESKPAAAAKEKVSKSKPVQKEKKPVPVEVI